MKKNIAQYLQNIAIGSILIVGGKIFEYIDITWIQIAVTVITTLCFEYIFAKKFTPSSLNSSIGICLFLRTSNIFIYIFTAFMAIAIKHTLRYKGKHFLNPSYTAIFLSLCLFPFIAYTNPLQWNGHLLPILGMLLLGIIVQSQVKFFDGIIAFALSFIIYFFTLTSGAIGEFQTLIITGSFIIVTFFGFTDPATTPKKSIDRVLFMIQISTLFFLLRFWINENYALFAAYLITQLCEPLYRYLEDKSIRTQAHVVSLSIALIITLFTTFQYTQNNNGNLPDILSNRCNQLFCK